MLWLFLYILNEFLNNLLNVFWSISLGDGLLDHTEEMEAWTNIIFYQPLHWFYLDLVECEVGAW